jgi:hypothetical protein
MYFRGSLVSSGMRALEVGHLGKKLNPRITKQLRDWGLRAVEKKINACRVCFKPPVGYGLGKRRSSTTTLRKILLTY